MLIAVLVVIVTLTIGLSTSAYAILGAKLDHGYFYGKTDTCSPKTESCDVIDGGISSKSPSKLIKELKNYYKKGGQNKIGATFVVKTMLGEKSKAPHGKVKLTTEELDDLEARITALDDAGLIAWSQNEPICGTNSYYQPNNKDDAFYKRTSKISPCIKEKSIVFYASKSDMKKDKAAYILDRECANPMGELKPLPPIKWKISTDTSVNAPNLLPGGTITWTHTVKNTGPDDTTLDVKYRYDYKNTIDGSTKSGNGSDHKFAKGAQKNDKKSFTSSYTITSNDAGNNYCRATSAKPEGYDSENGGLDNNRTFSSYQCVAPPYSYTLSPFISSSVSGAIEANTQFTITPYVTSTGPTRSKPTQWQVTQIVVVPGGSVPNAAGGNSPQLPCGTYFSDLPNASCSTVKTGNTVFNADGTYQRGNTLNTNSVIARDYEVGTKLCFAFSVQPHSSSDDQWAHSAPICMVISKKPKLQIWGNDAISGGVVQTSTSDKNIGGTGHRFGSWDEYAIFALNSISGMGSGSAFAGSGLIFNPITGNSCTYNTLTFTNSADINGCTNGYNYGLYANITPIPDVSASFPVDSSDPSHNLGSNPTIDLTANNLQGKYKASGTVTINGGAPTDTIKKGQWIVINAPAANVTINGDIHYTSEKLSSIDDIPQVVIIANNINIPNGVTNIDAWLVASGNINTCSSVATAAPLWAGPGSPCDQHLTVNGPVMANKIYFRRTAGSGVGPASGDPAEVFNLRPDAYLWSVAQANANGHAQTVNTINLPPRF